MLIDIAPSVSRRCDAATYKELHRWLPGNIAAAFLRPLRRWLETLHTALQQWYHACARRLPGSERLDVERLEERTVAGSVVPLFAALGTAAIVHTTERSGPGVIMDTPPSLADASLEAFSLEDQDRSDRVFRHTPAADNSFSEVSHWLSAGDPFSSSDDAPQKHPANDKLFDPVMASENALLDPLSNPAGDAKPQPHHHAAPIGNGLNNPPPNLAGAGTGPGGASTPAAPGGGSPSGGGGGSDPLHGLNRAISESTAAGNANVPASAPAAPVAPSVLTPGGDPPIPFVEGTSSGQVVGTFTDSDGNTDPTKYTASIDWGNGQQTTGFVTYSNGQFQIQGVMTYAEEGSYPITTTVTDQDGDIITVIASAAVSDAALTAGMPSPISATAGQQYNGQFGNFSDGNHNAPASDFSVQINWGDTQTSAGSVTAAGNGNFQVGGSHTYTAPGTYTVSATVTDEGGSQTTINTTANVTAGSLVVTNPGPQNSAEGAAISLQIQASGGTGALSFGSTDLPSGLSIDSTTGLISGTIDYSDAETQGGSYPVTITVFDSTGASSSTTFNWTVTNTNTPPTLDNPGNLTNWQGDAVALQLSASDPDGDPLTYSASGLPAGVSLNTTTGLISGVLAAPAGASSPYTVTVSVSDGVNTAQQTFTWTVATVQVDSLADQSNLIGDSVSLPINAWDQSGQSLTYSATGLPPGLTINSTTGLISGTIASNASVTTPYTVTVTATDGTDPTSISFAWTISNFVLDNPGDQTNAEGDAVAIQPTIETNGNPTLTFSATGLPSGLSINPSTGLIAGTIANLDSNSSPYSVTVSATDGTSTSSQTFTWTITHVLITDPGEQINAPGDVVSLPIQASDPDHDTLSYSATGLPSGLSINTTSGVISGTIASTAGSDTPYSVTVTASDGTHTATDTFNWTVANQAITVANPGTQSNAEGANVSLQISATDSSGNAMNFTAIGLPAGLQIDYANGIISGTIDGSAAETNGGVYKVTVLADDGQGNNGSTTFTWNVSHTNQAPTLDNPGDQVDQTGDAVSLPLNGYDGDGDTVTYSATGLPPGLSIDTSSGLISGTLPATAGSGTPYSVTVTASDGTLTAQQTFNWFVTANTVTLTNPGDQTSTEGGSVSLQLSASGSGLSYQASGLPAGLSINGSTGLISGTISSGDAANGPYFVLVTATDSQGNSSGQWFQWNVTAANLNPVVTSAGSQINTQDDVLALQITATDPAGNGLTYSAVGLPPGLTINSSSGLISGVLPSSSGSGSPYTVTVTATDGSYSGSTTFTWSVTNQAVTVTNPGTQNSTGGNTVSLQISANDPAQLPLTYAAVGLPSGLTINASTGLISGTLDSTDGGTYQVTVMASDSQGNSGSVSFNWNVTYLNQTPTLDNPGAQLNQAGDAVSVAVSGYDVDGDSVSYSATGLPSGLSIASATGIISGTLMATAGRGTPYSVTVTVSDGTLQASQTFNWFVTANPVTLTNPGDQTNTEGNSVSLQLSASGSGLTYEASGLPSGVTLNSSTGLISGTVAAGDAADGPYVVTVTATDTQGHSSAEEFIWNVSVPANSLTLTNPGNLSNAEGDDVAVQAQANDPDGDWLTYAASGLPIGVFINPITGLIQGTVDYSAAEIAGGQYHVTVTVNDGNGQTASQSFVWTISDTEQGPWLAYPGLQNNAVNDQVSLQLKAGSPDGHGLTYSVSPTAPLPAGLSLDPQSGLISGILQGPAKNYTVTVLASDGLKTASQTFTWQVASSPVPRVILALNGTEDHSDDVGLLNPTVVIPLRVKLENASSNQLHTIQISIPSGFSEVSQSEFKLANGGSMTIWLTPLKISQAPDDVEIDASVDGLLAASQRATNTRVTFGNNGNIRYEDTPQGMVNRIPPGNALTKVTVNLGTKLGDGEHVFIIIHGDAYESATGNNPDRDPQAGEVFFFEPGNDQIRAHVLDTQGDHIYLLKADKQTEPKHAGEIHLDVEYSPTEVVNGGKSAGFSVAAIPDLVGMAQPEPREGFPSPSRNPKGGVAINFFWGASYPIVIRSDSDDFADLQQYVSISEILTPDELATGIFSESLGNPQWASAVKWAEASDKNGYSKNITVPPQLFGAPPPILDARLKPDAVKSVQADINFAFALGTEISTAVVDQYFKFGDARLGIPANDAGSFVVPQSGFRLYETAFQDDNLKYWITVSRSAAALDFVGAKPGRNGSTLTIKAEVK